MKNSGTGRWTRPRQTLEAGNALQMKKNLHGTLQRQMFLSVQAGSIMRKKTTRSAPLRT